ncbi:splicing factor YJU2 [Onthophagus taurus]|uniref:splicing factor YJU2 n=1 Tax=Onthophagus taurus TaxID=166361 RepID=UPI000C204DB1|nr:coiled-coil domain-containing protein 94 [Onthophagus taurus]
MSERKVLNKYYPPDFDPSKIPRMKLPKNRQYTVRLMAPFNMRCATCGEYIYKGKKFNARKEDVENEDYLGIRIYRFYIKCTRCLQEISFKTDPRSTDYEIEAGATRNFMALKLAEEQALREEEELKEEEANNPMKLLENRTKQSKNEIELLESLEELKDLNRRQEAVDYDSMLSVYDSKLTEREREEKLKQLDEDYIKTVNFQSKRKFVVEEEIIEDEVPFDQTQTNSSNSSSASSSKSLVQKSDKIKSNNDWDRKVGILSSKKFISGLVKPKAKDVKAPVATISKPINNEVVDDKSNSKKLELKESNDVSNLKIEKESVPKNGTNSLLLLAAYSDSDNSD